MTDPRPWETAEPAPVLAVADQHAGAAGATTELSVTVTNAATAPRVVTVVALGIDPSWTQGPVRTDVLAPGASTTVALVLAPPSGTFPARYPMVVTAQALDPVTGQAASGGGSGTAIAETTLVVNPRTRLSVELDPDELTLVATRRISLVLRNEGEEPATVRLTERSTHALHVRVPDRVEVPAGGTLRVRGRVRVKTPRFVGYHSDHRFIVTAHSADAVRTVDGAVRQRSVVGPVGAKATALVAVLAVWLAAAVVFVPPLTDWLGSRGERTVAAGGQGSGGADGDRGGEGGDGSSGGAAGGGGGPDGSGAAGAGGGSTPDRLLLSGSVSAEEPAGVRVRIEPTSLVDEEALGGVRGVGVPASALTGTGMRLASALVPSARERSEPQRTVSTAADGSWALPAVRRPGYYLLTFTKPGYQEQKFVVDSATATAEEPLEVDLQPGEGTLAGTITGPGGPVGGATVTITDGLNTVTTSSASRGRKGRWEITGLSTPSSYVVEARHHDLTSEARVVTLAAGGSSARADLTLARGVRSLVGRVRSRGFDSRPVGVGGLQVSVTDSAGSTRTATTLTGSAHRAGRFVVPDLPAPGTYTVSVSGEGYQTETHTVRLRAGGAPRPAEFDIVVATGQVHGRIRLEGDPATVDAGLVLANHEHTYKTSTGDSGEYTINGVAPGDYTLSIQSFKYATEHLNVTVDPGPRVRPVNRTLRRLTGDGFPAASSLRGSAVDATTGVPLTCGGDLSPCTATIVDPVHEDESGNPAPHTATFEPSAAYVLPQGADRLSAGLHVVEVTAPGYEPARVSVEVPENQVAQAPVAALFPAPRVRGTVTSRADGAALDACVWVTADPVVDPAADLPGCQAAQDAAGPGADPRAVCRDGRAPYDAVVTAPQPGDPPFRSCAATTASGGYDIQVPTQGTWWVQVVPTDPEHPATAAEQVVLPRASIVERNLSAHRLGRVQLTVLKPGPGGTLVGAEGITPAITPALAVPLDPSDPSGRTDADGRILLRGLSADPHTITVERDGDGRPAGSTTVAAGANATEAGQLRLVDPLDAVVGRVRGNVHPDGVPVAGATVTLRAITGYNGSNQPVHTDVTATTDAAGCFAVVPVAGAAVPAYPGCTAYDDSDATVQPLASDRVERITVAADGFHDLEVATETVLSFSGLNSYTLEPRAVGFSGTLSVLPDPADQADVPWSDIDVTVVSGPEDAGEVTIGVAPGSSLGVGDLSWDDDSLPEGQVLPGTYRLRASLDGYAADTGDLVCAPVATNPCTFTEPLVLRQLGTVRVQTVAGSGADEHPVEDATVQLVLGGETVTGTRSGHTFTFTGVPPTVGTPTEAEAMRFRVRAAGHATGTTSALAPQSGDEVLLDCGGETWVSLDPADTTTCKLRLTPLGALRVTAVGVLGPEDAEATETRAIPAAQVTVTRCSSTSGGTCTTDATKSFTGTTDEHGEVRITGTLNNEGLRAGSWLVTAVAPGYRRAAGSGPGAIVQIEPAHYGTTHPAEVQLHAKAVTVRIHVTDGRSPASTITDATVLLRKQPVGGPQLVAQRVGSGADTRYELTDVIPGRWEAVVSGDALRPTSLFFDVHAEDDSVQERVVPVAYGSASLTGVITEAGGNPVEGAEVVLRCIDQPTSTSCPADGPALGTDLAPLTATTGADGRYTVDRIPVGAFTAAVRGRGFTTATGAALAFVDGDAHTWDAALEPVTHDVGLTLASTDPGEPLGGTQVRLVPVGDTPGAPLGSTLAGGGGQWTASLLQVRWGCYRVELTLPAGHLAAPSGPDGAPSDPTQTCPAGTDLVVPSAEDAPAIDLGYEVDAARLQFAVTATPVLGRTAPAVTLTLTSGATTHTVPAAAGDLWLPRGSWTAEARVAAGATGLWPVVTQTVHLPGGGASLETTLTEQTADVTVDLTAALSGLPPGTEALLQVSPGSGQLAHVPADVPASTTGGTALLRLPSGRWVITADWPGGPGIASIDVTGPMTVTPDPEP